MKSNRKWIWVIMPMELKKRLEKFRNKLRKTIKKKTGVKNNIGLNKAIEYLLNRYEGDNDGRKY